jgi:cytochrome P450
VAGRIAIADLEIGGHTVRKGQTIGVMLGGANRDPRAFANPNQLDLTRWPNPHLGMGRGIHFCIGGPLVRLEGPIALTALITRFPKLRRTGEGKRRHNVHVRGFESLPVSLT